MLFRSAATIHIDSAKLEELLKMIARGLTWYHWNAYIGPDYYASVLFVPDLVTLDFQDRVRSWNTKQQVACDFGHGTVQYEGVRTADPQELTAWAISMYGGTAISDGSGPAANCPSASSPICPRRS